AKPPAGRKRSAGSKSSAATATAVKRKSPVARKAAGSASAAGLASRLLSAKPKRAGLVDCVAGIAFGAAGARRYFLYKPPGMALAERLPLLVMLHGCGQDPNAFALSTRMNRIAAR